MSSGKAMSERVEGLLGEMTLEEKAALTTGVDMWHAHGVPRLGIRGLKVTDGPNGARGAYMAGTTSACLPCGTALGATWDPDLVRELGVLLGEECRTKGADLLLAPTVNIHRSPLAGRNFECYSEDPFLTARLAVAYVEGVQSTGVGTAVKHLVANDSEFERHTISSEVRERALREIYLPPFEAAIGEARSLSVMAAYNRLNGTYCSEHPWLMELVHDEWDLAGFVISDWWSIKSTIGTGRHGCDLEMPGPPTYLGEKLAAAVHEGEVPEAALDGKVRRVLSTMERLGVLDQPEHVMDTSVDRPGHRELLRRAARQAIVLLRNDGVLPLRPETLRSLAVIGPNADVAVVQGGGSAAVTPHHAVTVLDGLRARLGDRVVISHEPGVDAFRTAPPLDLRWTTGGSFRLEYFDNRDLAGEPVHASDARSARLMWLGDPWPGVPGGGFSARLTCELAPAAAGEYTLSLVVGGKGRVYVDDELVLDMWDQFRPGSAFFGLGSEEIRVTVPLGPDRPRRLRAEVACLEGIPAAGLIVGGIAPTASDGIGRAVAAARDADAAIVVVGLNQDWETEGEDRSSFHLPGRQDELVAAVAAANPRTVVLVNAGSPVAMDWESNAAAVAQLWYLGQECGHAVADVLLGDHSPCGKLPTSFPMRLEDTPSFDTYPGEHGQAHYGEGVFVGYRWYDHRRIEPRFCFGHGLSYTTFEIGPPQLGATTIGPGDGVDVTVEVANTGDRRGAEVLQVYVTPARSPVMRPPQELKGFARVELDPGERRRVTIRLDERAFSSWDPVAHRWWCAPGRYGIRAGASSRNLRGEAELVVE